MGYTSEELLAHLRKSVYHQAEDARESQKKFSKEVLPIFYLYMAFWKILW